jgi:hypothetical protein
MGFWIAMICVPGDTRTVLQMTVTFCKERLKTHPHFELPYQRFDWNWDTVSPPNDNFDSDSKNYDKSLGLQTPSETVFNSFSFNSLSTFSEGIWSTRKSSKIWVPLFTHPHLHFQAGNSDPPTRKRLLFRHWPFPQGCADCRERGVMASDGTRFLGYEGRGLAQSEEEIEVWNGCDIPYD